jgi:hypothetical protein
VELKEVEEGKPRVRTMRCCSRPDAADKRYEYTGMTFYLAPFELPLLTLGTSQTSHLMERRVVVQCVH